MPASSQRQAVSQNITSGGQCNSYSGFAHRVPVGIHEAVDVHVLDRGFCDGVEFPKVEVVLHSEKVNGKFSDL